MGSLSGYYELYSVTNGPLPKRILKSPLFQTWHCLASYIIAGFNDILLLKKDVLNGETGGMIMLHVLKYGKSLEEARKIEVDTL